MSDLIGNLFVVSAPSGAGKSSLLRALRQRCPWLGVAVSHTTRPPRPGERDGEHYHFVSSAAFRTMVERGEFLEHAQVFDHYYGTSEMVIRELLGGGGHLVLEIDWQGARQVRHQFPDACCIFIVPPSVQVLRERLIGRGQDNTEVIERRMRDAQSELAHYSEYDYLLVNDVFERTVEDLYCILVAHGLRAKQQSRRLATLLDDLLASISYSSNLD